MARNVEKIAITGANGNLGKLVVKGLLQKVPPNQIVAAVRCPEKSNLRERGVEVRKADYDRPETLTAAFTGIEKLLLISAVAPGERFRQHKAVIDAAKQSGVTLVAYTSMLRADTSTMILATEHKQTEDYLKEAGLTFVLLRNGWYLENHTGSLESAVTRGTIMGCAGLGRFASASRSDYASAAVNVLSQTGHENKTYELAGNHSFSMYEFAEEVSRQANRTVVYNDVPVSEYEAALLSLGLPQMIVDVVIDADLKSLKGDLDSSSRDLSTLIGRETTSVSQAIKSALLPLLNQR
jgi:NAD(P)H dehydrogenase (quinone)